MRRISEVIIARFLSDLGDIISVVFCIKARHLSFDRLPKPLIYLPVDSSSYVTLS